MAKPDSAYWLGVAQLLPVIAVAIVVEARLVSRRWDLQIHMWVRVVQWLTWSVPLIGMIYVVPAALGAARGAPAPNWLPGLAEGTTRIGLISIVVSPVAELGLRAWAEVVARLTVSPDAARYWRFQIERRWKYRREFRRMKKQLDDQLKAVEEQGGLLREVIERVEADGARATGRIVVFEWPVVDIASHAGDLDFLLAFERHIEALAAEIRASLERVDQAEVEAESALQDMRRSLEERQLRLARLLVEPLLEARNSPDK